MLFFLLISANTARGDTNSTPTTYVLSPYLQETIIEIKKNTANLDSINFHRDNALKYAENKNTEKANEHIESYIKASGDISFVDQHEFEVLQDSLVYQEIVNNFQPKLDIWVLFFLFSSIVGIFISVILNFQNNTDKSANVLIALFVLFHSILIADFGLYASNYRFQIPNSLFISTTFSFLYGPLLYFYFKKTTSNYKFKPLDVLHLVPSLILLIYIFPYYILESNEKLHLMLNIKKYLDPGGSLIFLSKAVSLCIYAFLIFKMYKKQSLNLSNRESFRSWQKRMSAFFSVYALSYVIYGLSIFEIIDMPYLSNIQGAILSCLVLYIAYMAFAKPMVFLCLNDEPLQKVFQINGNTHENEDFNGKYQKSGLTNGFSLELKDNLINLLNNEKIFKTNNLTLELLAQKLDTNRHNASQVINEHFDVNFFELINQYRIREAKLILEDDLRISMNIIDVAYEVGYNNKVTFNKSFKKETLLTPSRYRELHKHNPNDNFDEELENSAEGSSNLFSGSGLV